MYKSIIDKGKIPIKILNTATDTRTKDVQIVTVTLSKLREFQKRKEDFSELRVFVIDEADVYFDRESDINDLKKVVE